MKRLPRLLLVWNWVPCNATGAGIILRRLLQGYPENRLWLLTAAASARSARGYDPVPSPEHQASVLRLQVPRRFAQPFVALVNVMLIPIIVLTGVKLVRRENLEAVLGVPWDPFFLSAYFIHRFTKVPLHVYFMDDPAGSPSYAAWKAVFYRALMPKILRAASRVWCVSEYMAESLRRRYGVDAQTLLPLLDVAAFVEQAQPKRTRRDNEVRIVYTGAIYDAQLDALQNLVSALHGASPDFAGARDVRLLLYTSQPEPLLERMGLAGPCVRRAHVPLAEMPRVLAEADILFLPFSFDPKMRHVIETSLPTKLAEYLASGVPILVHAPPHATVARYCREHECALVVDKPEPEVLRAAITRLMSDNELRRNLSERARSTALNLHDRERNLPRFLESLSRG